MNMVGIKKFDRKAESANKMKNRMKSYMNKGKSLNHKYSHILNPMKDRNSFGYGGVFNFSNTNYNGNNFKDDFS
jgi:hypothetical protein